MVARGGARCVILTFWIFLGGLAVAHGVSCAADSPGGNRVLVGGDSDSRGRDGSPEVWYVPGWMRTAVPREGNEAWANFRKTFTGARLQFHSWDGNCLWKNARANADADVERLVGQIVGMGDTRTNLTLVGHSLGGRIVVRTLARLAERKLKIHQGVLLAAAIPNSDPDVALMGEASILPVLSVCNPKDVTLRFVYRMVGGESSAALGASGALTSPTNTVEYSIPVEVVKEAEIKAAWGNSSLVRKVANHHALFYNAALRRVLDGTLPDDQPILVPQEKLNIELKVMDAGIWWDVLEARGGWKLERNIVTRHCRILDPERRRTAWGREADMRTAYAKIVERLKSTIQPVDAEACRVKGKDNQ